MQLHVVGIPLTIAQTMVELNYDPIIDRSITRPIYEYDSL